MSNEVIAVQQNFHELCKDSFRNEFDDKENSTCLGFLEKRRLPIDQLLDENLDIGYCPPDFDPTVLGDIDIVKTAGLMNENDEFMLTGRIIFTHYDGENNIRYFSGRSLDPNVDKDFKYLGQSIYSEEKEYIDKNVVSRIFWRDRRYNISDYRKDANELKPIVIVESVLEAIALNFEFGNDYYAIAATSNHCSDVQHGALITELNEKNIAGRKMIYFGDNDKGKQDKNGKAINPGFEGSIMSASKMADMYNDLQKEADEVYQEECKEWRKEVREEKARAKQAKQQPDEIPEPVEKKILRPYITVTVQRKPPDVTSIDIGDHYQAGRIGELDRALKRSENLWYWDRYGKDDPMRFFDDKVFVPARVLFELEREGYYFLTINKQILQYKDGMYLPAEIVLNPLLVDKLGVKYSPKRTSEVRSAIMESTIIEYEYDSNSDVEVFDGPRDFTGGISKTQVAAKNGIVDLDKVFDNPFKALIPSSPYIYVPTTINAIYDPNLILEIKCDDHLDWDIYRMFYEIFVCNPNCEKGCTETEGHDVKNLWLWFEGCGYSLIRTTDWKKFFVLHGPSGNNGKSTATNALATTLGHINVSRVALADFDNPNKRFAIASIQQKLANIAQEIGTGSISQTAKIKMLTGDDTIEIEKKGIDAYNYKPYATLFFAVNELPNFKDKSSPFLNRIAFIDCPNQFVTNSEVSNIFRTDEDISKMFALCCLGYERLRQRKGVFTEPERHKQIMEQFVLRNNPLAQFVADCIDYDLEQEQVRGCSITSKDLRAVFKTWCEKEYPTMRELDTRRFNELFRKAVGFPADSKNIYGNKGHQGSTFYGISWSDTSIEWRGQQSITDELPGFSE